MPLNVYLSKDLVAWLDDEATQKGISRAELVSVALQQIDMKLASRTASQISKLRKAVMGLTKSNAELMEKYITSVEGKLDRIINVYAELPEPDEYVKAALKNHMKTFLKIAKANDGPIDKVFIDSWVEITYKDVEKLALNDSKSIERPKLMKKIIRNIMLKSL